MEEDGVKEHTEERNPKLKIKRNQIKNAFEVITNKGSFVIIVRVCVPVPT